MGLADMIAIGIALQSLGHRKGHARNETLAHVYVYVQSKQKNSLGPTEVSDCNSMCCNHVGPPLVGTLLEPHVGTPCWNHVGTLVGTCVGTMLELMLEKRWNLVGTLLEPCWNPVGTQMLEPHVGTHCWNIVLEPSLEPCWNPHVGTMLEPCWNPDWYRWH